MGSQPLRASFSNPPWLDGCRSEHHDGHPGRSINNNLKHCKHACPRPHV